MRRRSAISHRLGVIALAVEGGEKFVLTLGWRGGEQGAVGFGGPEGPFEVRGGRGVNGTVRLDVVALGDHSGRVAQEGRRGVGPDATGDDGRASAGTTEG